MPRPVKTWVISDTHFHHDMLVRVGMRPADHAEKLLANCRRLVAAQDTLIHLGDVIFYHYPRLPDLLRPIPGRKVLVMGNHDRKSRNWYQRNGFDFVCDALVLGKVYLTHKPVATLPPGCLVNVHGHLHDRVPPPFPHCRLVALELNGYMPVELSEVIGPLPESREEVSDDGSSQ
jgi:calcineurin-like phosphoesterase family protein